MDTVTRWLHSRPHTALLEAFFGWARSIAQENDIFFVNLDNKQRYFRFYFPLKQGEGPQKYALGGAAATPTFIVRTPASVSPGENWQILFRSPEVEIFENRKRFQGNRRPLRWGLTSEEKLAAFRLARDAVDTFFNNGGQLPQQYYSSLSPRFFERTTVGVAAWIDGHCRGSMIVEGRLLGYGIAEAALRALRDFRFKPISPQEFASSQIEVAIISDLRIPLAKAEIQQNAVYHDKGYVLQLMEKTGWFLPEVMNVARFSNLTDFLERLAEKKAHLPRGALESARVCVFEISDFIESSARSHALPLVGPVVYHTTRDDARELPDRLQRAAEWMRCLQNSDGSMPSIVDPFSARNADFSLPRLAFAAYALAAYANVVRSQIYLKAARRSFEYLKRTLLIHLEFTPKGYELALAYLGRLALACGDIISAVAIAEKIRTLLGSLQFEPIAFAQISGLLYAVGGHEGVNQARARDLLHALEQKFGESHETKRSMQLAQWAECVNAARLSNPQFALRVEQWLLEQQLPDGSFSVRADMKTTGTHVRSTGKIFEILALRKEENGEPIKRVLRWLYQMQYDSENTFFIPEGVRSQVVGGFRHDYGNSELWIDAAGHFLLGGARILANSKKKNGCRSRL